MENLSEFWKEVKERASNPFIFSFVLLWLVYNWRIPVGILFLDSNDYKLEGHLTLIEYLNAEIKNVEFWKPVGYAALYCLLFAASKEIIRVTNAGINRIGSWAYFKVSEKSSVDFELYTQQIRELDANKKEIETLLKDARTKDQERLAAKTELATVKQSLSEVQHKYTIAQQASVELSTEKPKFIQAQVAYDTISKLLNRLHDTTVIEGRWNVTVGDDGRGNHQEVIITSVRYATSFEHNETSILSGFFYDAARQEVTFHRTRQVNSRVTTLPPVYAYLLTIQDENNMVGTENGQPIRFRRHQDWPKQKTTKSGE